MLETVVTQTLCTNLHQSAPTGCTYWCSELYPEKSVTGKCTSMSEHRGALIFKLKLIIYLCIIARIDTCQPHFLELKRQKIAEYKS